MTIAPEVGIFSNRVVNVAPQLHEGQIGANPRQLCPASHRARRHGGATVEFVEWTPDQHVARVATFTEGGDAQPVGGRRRQIFRAVHRHVGAAVEHR